MAAQISKMWCRWHRAVEGKAGYVETGLHLFSIVSLDPSTPTAHHSLLKESDLGEGLRFNSPEMKCTLASQLRPEQGTMKGTCAANVAKLTRFSTTGHMMRALAQGSAMDEIGHMMRALAQEMSSRWMKWALSVALMSSMTNNRIRHLYSLVQGLLVLMQLSNKVTDQASTL